MRLRQRLKLVRERGAVPVREAESSGMSSVGSRALFIIVNQCFIGIARFGRVAEPVRLSEFRAAVPVSSAVSIGYRGWVALCTGARIETLRTDTLTGAVLSPVCTGLRIETRQPSARL